MYISSSNEYRIRIVTSQQMRHDELGWSYVHADVTRMLHQANQVKREIERYICSFKTCLFMFHACSHRSILSNLSMNMLYVYTCMVQPQCMHACGIMLHACINRHLLGHPQCVAKYGCQIEIWRLASLHNAVRPMWHDAIAIYLGVGATSCADAKFSMGIKNYKRFLAFVLSHLTKEIKKCRKLRERRGKQHLSVFVYFLVGPTARKFGTTYIAQQTDI